MDISFHQISLILIEDPPFIKDILRFADLLGTPASERTILERDIRTGVVNYYEWIIRLLARWASRRGKSTLQDLIKVLKEMNCLNVAERLENIFSPNGILSHAVAGSSLAPSTSLNRIWNVVEPVPNFVGREEELTYLNQFLQNERSQLLVISGMGGQGKTELCRKWIQGLKKEETSPRIIWLSGENNYSLMMAITAFLKTLTDCSKVRNFEDLLALLTTVLEDESVTFVIDNVDTEYEEINTFVYNIMRLSKCKVVSTSKLRTILPEIAEYLTLEPLSSSAARQMVLQNVRGVLLGEEIDQLCREMGNHALALQISSSFIRSRQTTSVRGSNYGIKDFLSVYKNDKLVVIHEQDKFSGYDRSILHHVKLSMDLLEERGETLAQEIMKILSLLCSDGVEFDFLLSIIPKTYRRELMPTDVKEFRTAAEKALDSLNLLSLISADSSMIRVHPLVQESIQILYLDWKQIANLIIDHPQLRMMSAQDII